MPLTTIFALSLLSLSAASPDRLGCSGAPWPAGSQFNKMGIDLIALANGGECVLTTNIPGGSHTQDQTYTVTITSSEQLGHLVHATSGALSGGGSSQNGEANCRTSAKVQNSFRATSTTFQWVAGSEAVTFSGLCGAGGNTDKMIRAEVVTSASSGPPATGSPVPGNPPATGSPVPGNPPAEATESPTTAPSTSPTGAPENEVARTADGLMSVTASKEEDKVYATVSGEGQGWLAIGLPGKADNNMDGARAIVFLPSRLQGGSCDEAVGLIIGMTYDVAEQQSKYDAKAAISGVTACSSSPPSFTVELGAQMFLQGAEGESSPFYEAGLANGTVDIIIAHGPDGDEGFVQHEGESKGVFTGVNFAQAVAGDVTDDNADAKRKAHAVLMYLSWGLLLPSGVIVARLKDKADWWFGAHRAMQSVGLLLATIGWIIALSSFDVLSNFTDRFSPATRAHASLGVVIMLVGFFQPLNAFFRPSPGDSNNNKSGLRSTWELVHKNLGRLAVIGGLANIFVGCWVAAKITGNGKWPDSLSFAAVATTVLLMIAFAVIIAKALLEEDDDNKANGNFSMQPSSSQQPQPDMLELGRPAQPTSRYNPY